MDNDFKLTFLVESGPLKWSKFSIDEAMLCIVGREFDCTLRIDSSSVSRHHCLIEVKPPHVFVKDLGSTNGTFVNERQLNDFEDAKELHNGDKLRIGDNSTSVILPNRVSSEDTQSAKTNVLMDGKNYAQQVPIHGYHVKKELGRGGAGVVYLAEHETTGAEVAVKIMLPNVKVSTIEREMFFREIDLTKDLKHENVVRVSDFGYSNDIFFFALEFCNRGSVLSMMTENGGWLPVDVAVDITLQALDGLDYAHNFHIQAIKLKDGTERASKGIVHRDIKPENILLQNDNGRLVAKIADFGLSKAFKQAGFTMGTMTGAFCGTPGFVSRQQLLNYKYAKPEVDVWGLVATLYYMLSGAAPRGDDFGQNPLRMILEKEPVPIKSVAPRTPDKLAELIDSALDDKKALKFKTALAFKKALVSVRNEIG